MAEISWVPPQRGVVPDDVFHNPERAVEEARYDREKIMQLPLHLAIGILLDRIEKLEAGAA